MTTKPEILQGLIDQEVARRAAHDAALVAPYKERIALLEAALRLREWMGKGYDHARHCPHCRGYEDEGHKADCIVGIALTGA